MQGGARLSAPASRAPRTPSRAGGPRLGEHEKEDSGEFVDAPFFVADEDGRALPGADVVTGGMRSATDAQGRVLLRVQTGIGSFLAVEKDGYRRWVGSIDPADEVSRVVLERDRGSPLLVRLVGAAVEDGVEVHLWLAPEGSDAVEESLASARGRAVKFAHSLAPGSYVLAGTAPGLVSGHAAVRVFDGLAAEATLEMAPPRSVTGLVMDRRGAPIAGATVAWRQRPACSCGQGLPEITGADG